MAATPIPENLVAEGQTVTTVFADVKRSRELLEDLVFEEGCAIVAPALTRFDAPPPAGLAWQDRRQSLPEY